MTTLEATYKPEPYEETFNDLALEALKRGKLKQFIEEMAIIEAESHFKESIVYILSEIVTSKTPLNTAKIICICAGLPICSESLEELASGVGKSRQAIHSQFEAMKKKLGLTNKLRTEKSAVAKANYILTNQRNFKEEDQE